MNSRNKSLTDWLTPSPGDALFLGVFFFVLRIRNGLIETPGTARHILTGKLILASHWPPHSDPFSFTRPGAPWVSHDWLSEVLFASLYRISGYGGIIILVGLCIALTMLIMFRFMLRRGVNLFIALAMVCLSDWVINAFAHARPEVFSILFTLTFFIVLDLFQQEDANWLKSLPFLMVLWANLTGDFAVGLGLILFYVVCNASIGLTTTNQAVRSACTARCRKLGITFGAVVAAALINPIGPSLLLFQFRLARVRFFADSLNEWISPNFNHYFQGEILLLLLIATFAFSRRRADFVEAGLLLVTVFFGLLFIAYFPLIVVIAAPIAAVLISHSLDQTYVKMPAWAGRLWERIAKSSEHAATIERARTAHLLALSIVIVWFGLAIYSNRTGRIHFTDREWERASFPVDALEFAVANGVSGNLFNEQHWAGYILLNSYPRYKVFMDDRYEMYGQDVVAQYLKVANVEMGFERVLKNYDINWVLFKANSPICRVLFLNGWKLVYADGVADIFVRDIPENADLIRKYPKVYFVPDGMLRVYEYDRDPTGTAQIEPED